MALCKTGLLGDRTRWGESSRFLGGKNQVSLALLCGSSLSPSCEPWAGFSQYGV